MAAPAITRSRLWAAIVLAGIFLVLGRSTIPPNDLWWHLRAGQWIVDHRRIPAVDLFSFTLPGQPWAYQSWLMEVVLFLLWQLGQAPLALFANAVAITAAYALVLRASQLAAGNDLRMAALATLLAAIPALPNSSVRPQTLSILLFAVVLWLIERHASRQGQSGHAGALWLLPPLFILWANGHGGFVFGLALLGTYLLAGLWAWVRRQAAFPWQLTAVTLLSALATLLTPLGPGMAGYVLRFAQHPTTRSYSIEFFSPTLQSPDGRLLFALLLVLVVAIVASRRQPEPRETLRLLLFVVLALLARRNIVWFCFVAAPTLAASLHALLASRQGPPRAARERPSLNLAILALVGLLVVVGLPWLRPLLPFGGSSQAYLSEDTPVAAVARLCTLGGDGLRTFNEQTYGTYMTWACPSVPVFIDTRIEFYPPELWQDYFAASAAREDWQDILDRHAIDTLLLSRAHQGPLIAAATASDAWQQAYADGQAAIFQRLLP